ncbi:MAG: tetratricopeptide repeat protein [Rhodothermia bacterium]|nr:tetratricopeptide repeat protein [Rhodothermia bacterium]
MRPVRSALKRLRPVLDGAVGLTAAVVAAALLSSACRAQDQQTIRAVNPSTVVVQKIDSLMQLRQFDESIRYLTAMAAANPNMRLLHLNLGYAYGNKGDHEAAITHFKKELERDPNSWQAVSLLGQAYEAKGDLEQAREYFGTWREIQPERWESHYHEGKVCFELGHAKCADEAFEAGLALNPQSADLLVGKGRVQMAENDLEGARKTFSQAFMLDASNADANYNLGQVLIRLGDVEQGKRVLEQFRKLSEQEDELDYLRQSRDVAGAGAENTFAVGEALLNQGRYDEAMQEYQNAVAVDSTFWPAHHRIAFVMTRKGQYDKALRPLLAAQRLAPESFDVRYDLAKNYALLRQTEEAKQWLESALEVRSLDAAESRFIAELFVRTGITEYGMQVLSDWLEENPEDHESHFVMGLLLHLTSDVAGAGGHYTRAILLSPETQHYRVVHSMALAALGKKNAAEDALKAIPEDALQRHYAKYRSLTGAAALSQIASESLGINLAGSS